MSENDDYGTDSSNELESIVIPVWELLFENNEKGKLMILDTLLNKKVKVWSVLASTINGVRGTMKGQVGILTSFDDEFIVVDNTIILSRKFIYRIELA